MFIVPFIRVAARANLQQIWLFLERNGTHLIEIDATSDDAVQHAKEFAELNEFTLTGEPFCVDDVVYCPIEPKADLANCYTWKEVTAGTTKEVWRTFLWVAAPDSTDPWGVNRLMDEISLSEKQTAYSVLKSIVGC
jgi:hypothetical protein